MTTRIWMYHRVMLRSPTAFGHPSCYHLRGTAITPEEWSEDLHRLRPVIALDAVVEALEAGRTPPAGNVITFDDGYVEWIDLVAPTLRAAGATATFFVTTSMHRAAPRPHAIDAYYWLLDHARAHAWSVTLPGGQVCEGDLRTAAGKRWLVTQSPIKRALVDGDAALQAAVVAAVERVTGTPLPLDAAGGLYMDEAQWKSLAQEHTIGLHGVTHRPWTTLTEGALNEEIAESRATLMTVTGGQIEFAAYPDGACNPRVILAARAAGCRAGLLAGEAADPGLFTLPRSFRRSDQ